MTGKNTQLPLLRGPVRIRVTMVREEGNPVPDRLRTPADISRYADELRDMDREAFAVVLLDAKNQAIGLHIATVGTIDASLIDPAGVFKAALLANAAGVCLVHNHPSRDPTPSAEDIRITKQLIEAGRILGINVLDHVVLGGPRQYVSMREEGIAEFGT